MEFYKNTDNSDIFYIDDNGVKKREIWFPIKGWEDYLLSDLGRVKSKERVQEFFTKKGLFRRKTKERILNQDISWKYPRVILQKNKKKLCKNVHRIIALNIIPNPENKPCVNHINGIKTDNRRINLEWCTHSENIQHAFDNGLNKYKKRIVSNETKKKQSDAKKGEKHPLFGKKRSNSTREKISNGNKGNVLNGVLILNSQTGIFYQNMRLASESIGINPKTLWSMLNGICTNKTYFIKA